MTVKVARAPALTLQSLCAARVVARVGACVHAECGCGTPLFAATMVNTHAAANITREPRGAPRPREKHRRGACTYGRERRGSSAFEGAPMGAPSLRNDRGGD